MNHRHPIRRWASRGSTAALAAVALATGLQAAATGAQASVPLASATAHPAVRDPYSPAFHHPYRRGVIPTRPQLARMHAWARSHPGAGQAPAASPNDLNYGG